MMKSRLLRRLIKNIERYDDDIYDITIIYNGIDIGHRAEIIRGIKYVILDEVLIRKLNKYDTYDNKFIITLYQGCEFKSDLLIFINQNYDKMEVGE